MVKVIIALSCFLLWGSGVFAEPEVRVLSVESDDEDSVLAFGIRDVKGGVDSRVKVFLDTEKLENGGMRFHLAYEVTVIDGQGFWLDERKLETFVEQEPIMPPIPEGYELMWFPNDPLPDEWGSR